MHWHFCPTPGQISEFANCLNYGVSSLKVIPIFLSFSTMSFGHAGGDTLGSFSVWVCVCKEVKLSVVWVDARKLRILSDPGTELPQMNGLCLLTGPFVVFLCLLSFSF